MDVGSLSCRAKFLTRIRSITDRLLLFPSSLARTPIGSLCSSLSRNWFAGGIRGCHVPHKYPDRLGAAFTPRTLHLRQGTLDSLCLAPYRLVQAYQHLWLVARLRCLQRFTCVHHTIQSLLLTALVLAELRSPHGHLFRKSTSAGYFVPRASHPKITPHACPGRIPVAEYRVKG